MREAALNVAALRKQAGGLYVVAVRTSNIVKVIVPTYLAITPQNVSRETFW
jgi:hypothetical protein